MRLRTVRELREGSVTAAEILSRSLPVRTSSRRSRRGTLSLTVLARPEPRSKRAVLSLTTRRRDARTSALPLPESCTLTGKSFRLATRMGSRSRGPMRRRASRRVTRVRSPKPGSTTCPPLVCDALPATFDPVTVHVYTPGTSATMVLPVAPGIAVPFRFHWVADV